jgi:hypothetical protein
VFRGSYPTLRHFRFLKSLKLKTILSMTPEPPSADLLRFAALFDVSIVHIPTVRTDHAHALQRQLAKAANGRPPRVHTLSGRPTHNGARGLPAAAAAGMEPGVGHGRVLAVRLPAVRAAARAGAGPHGAGPGQGVLRHSRGLQDPLGIPRFESIVYYVSFLL